MTNKRVSVAIFNDERELLGVIYDADDNSFKQFIFAVLHDEYATRDIAIIEFPAVENIGYGSSEQEEITAKIEGYEYTFYAERTYIY